MQKKDYQVSFGKIQKMQIQKMTQFLLECPIFGGCSPSIKVSGELYSNIPKWTRSALSKLYYFFKRVDCKRG
jgi:hypothetical protein